MLYIFDLGNVIVDIDFNRVLGAWSDLTRIPLAGGVCCAAPGSDRHHA